MYRSGLNVSRSEAPRTLHVNAEVSATYDNSGSESFAPGGLPNSISIGPV